jgi:methyl-accepting chemotaxis protein
MMASRPASRLESRFALAGGAALAASGLAAAVGLGLLHAAAVLLLSAAAGGLGWCALQAGRRDRSAELAAAEVDRAGAIRGCAAALRASQTEEARLRSAAEASDLALEQVLAKVSAVAGQVRDAASRIASASATATAGAARQAAGLASLGSSLTAAHLEGVSRLAGGVSARSSSPAAGLDLALRALREMERATQESIAAADLASDEAEELCAQADELADLVVGQEPLAAGRLAQPAERATQH